MSREFVPFTNGNRPSHHWEIERQLSHVRRRPILPRERPGPYMRPYERRMEREAALQFRSPRYGAIRHPMYLSPMGPPPITHNSFARYLTSTPSNRFGGFPHPPPIYSPVQHQLGFNPPHSYFGLTEFPPLRFTPFHSLQPFSYGFMETRIPPPIFASPACFNTSPTPQFYENEVRDAMNQWTVSPEQSHRQGFAEMAAPQQLITTPQHTVFLQKPTLNTPIRQSGPDTRQDNAGSTFFYLLISLKFID